ncbi:MAG: hypothetical protein F6K31_32970, partial [Symploca sp. SIO2G7]|nr:hypothetical protein [Symploca sp. SIO2G7]
WERGFHQGWYLFSLAKAQQQLGDIATARETLIEAKQITEPNYDPALYIGILKALRDIYFQQEEYLTAFELKQERQTVETQFGFRAFIGASRLQAKQLVTNPALPTAASQGEISLEIKASGREEDVKKLLGRVERDDCRLTIIHGQSGVGKSSLIEAGLIPTLQQQRVKTRRIVPVLQRVYTDWMKELERCLLQAEASFPNQQSAVGVFAQHGAVGAKHLGDNSSLKPEVNNPNALPSDRDAIVGNSREQDAPTTNLPISDLLGKSQKGEALAEQNSDARGNMPAPMLRPYKQLSNSVTETATPILAQLRRNSDRNLLTVLIFDQFEEFFFVYKEPKQRKVFYQFLRDCLNIPFVTVILSLREDYLYYLLECNNRLVNLDIANNDILNKNILNYLGNFDPAAAKLIIQNLTAQTQFSLEPELLDTLVRDLAGDLGEVSPIELQIVGAQLQAEKITKLADYQQLGSKEQLVGRFLDDVVKDCGKGNEQIAKLVLYLLTDENNTRPLKTRADLELELEVKGENLSLVLDILVKSGLILRVPANPTDRYQLVHDYLVTFVRQEQSERLIKELEKEREQRKITEKQLNEALNEVLKQKLKTTRRTVRGLGLLATAITVIAIIAVTAALNGFAAVLARQTSGEGVEQTVSSIKAGKLLKLAPWKIPDSKIFILLSLRRRIYDDYEINRLEGHTESITDVALSSNQKYIASASQDNTVRLWTVDGENIEVFEEHTENVNDVEFSPNNKIIASASDDTTIKLWNIDGTLVNTLRGHEGKVSKIRFSRDGKTVVSLAKDNVAILWNLENDKFKQLEDSEVYDFSFGTSTQDFFVVSTDIEGNKKYWSNEGDLIKKELIQIETTQEDTVIINPPVALDYQRQCVISDFHVAACISNRNIIELFSSPYVKIFEDFQQTFRVKFSPDSQKIAALSELRNNINIWQTDGKLTKNLKEYTSDIVFSNNNNNIGSISIGNTLNIWSVDSNQLETIIKSDTIFNDIEYSIDGELVGTSTDKDVKIWKIDGSLLQKFVGKTTVKFSLDSQLIALGNDEGIEIWRRDNSFFKKFAGKTTIEFSPDSQLIALGNDEGIEIWRRDSSFFKKFAGKTTVKFSPDSQLIALGNDEWISNSQETAILQRDGTLLKKFDKVKNVTFSFDSQLIAIQKINQIEIWQYNDQLRKIKMFAEYEIAKISSDAKLIVTVDKIDQIKVWEPNGTLVKTIKKDSSNVKDIIVSDGGNFIAAIIDNDNHEIVKIWNKDGILLEELKGDYSSDINTHIVFSPEGKLVAVRSENNEVNILNNSGYSINNFEGVDEKFKFIPNSQDFFFTTSHSKIKLWSHNGNLLKSFKNYGGRINSISFSPKGELIASASNDGEIQLWQSDGSLIKNFAAHEKRVNRVNFSPKGKFIVSASDDKTIKLWHLDGTLAETIEGHTEKVNDVKFTPNGNLIASASDDGTVKLWNLNGTPVKDLEYEDDYSAKNINFSHNGKVLTASFINNNRKKVVSWLIEGMFEKYVQYDYTSVLDISFSPDGKAIAVATDKGLFVKSLELDKLLQEGCDKIRDYLKNNPSVKERDRKLCDGIGTKE